MKSYNDKQIINRIINFKYTIQDVAPKVYPRLQHGLGMYCPFHENSHTGTQHARIYYNDDNDIWYMHCYVCGKNYFASDYVNLILVKSKQQYRSAKEFLLSKISQDEFIQLYKIFEKKKQELETNNYKKKCDWINNVYAETGNIIDYIETLYTS